METPMPTPPQSQLLRNESGMHSGYGSPPRSSSDRSASVASPILNSTTLAMPPQEPPVPAKPVGSRPDTIQGMQKFDRRVTEDMQRRFQDVFDRLSGPLATYLRKSRHEHRPTVIRLAFLGSDADSVRPWIVVFCPELVKKRAEKFFKKDMTQRIYQSDEPGRESFQVAVVGQPPRPRADDSASRVKVTPAYPDSPGSITLQVRAEHDGVSRCATMGGYIVASSHDGKEIVYGLTAGHITPPTGYDSASSDGPWDGSMPSPASSDTEDENTISPGLSDQRRNRRLIENSIELSSELPWTEMRLADVSFSREARDNDWAIIEGIQANQIDKASNTAFVLGTIGEQRALQIGYNVKGALHCILSRTPSMILTPSGHDFVRAHTLVPEASQSLEDGASGTWVVYEPEVDPDTSFFTQAIPPTSVYGQVVADDMFGDIYMLPLHSIMNDVKTLMNAAVVRLPTSTKELQQILAAQLHLDHTDPDHEKSSKDPHSLITDATAERINYDAYPGSMLDHSLVLESPTPLLSGKPKRSTSVRKPKRHVCGTCGRKYARREHLNQHERSHAQGYPFRCSQCTKAFYRKELLERHEARHHEALSAEFDDAETQTDYAEIDDKDVRDPTTNGKSIQEKISDMIVSPTRNVSALLHTTWWSVYPEYASSGYFPEDRPPSQDSPATEVSDVEDNCDDDISSNSHGAPKAKKSRTEVPWTSNEDLCLERMRSEGASWDRIMETFSDRTESSVKRHWYKDLHREGMAEEAPASASMPIVQLLIHPQMPDAKPLMVKVRVDSTIERPRLAWCGKEKFSEQMTRSVFFTWKGQRLYDSTLIKRLGIQVDDSGNVSVQGDSNIYDVNLPKIHVEAWTEDLYKQRKKEDAASEQGK